MNMNDFYVSFYVNFLFYVSLAFGATFFVLIQYATKVGWSVTVRRLAENVSLTLTLFFVLSLVTYFGRETLFEHWLAPHTFSDKVLNSKRWYLNEPFFYSRQIFYFVVFIAAAFIFSRQSVKQDSSGHHNITRKLQTLSIPFLIVCGFSITFIAFDWIMSLDPHWYSTIFGLYFFAGSYVAFLALLSILVFFVRNKKVNGLKNVFNVEHFHDLGKLVFGHSCFWAYAAFSQYLLIWYGNIPEETKWYAVRQSGNWWFIWTLLCVGHFIVPFVFLMARRAKRAPLMVCLVSVWMLIMHFVDIYWLVVPNFSKVGPSFSLNYVFSFIGIGLLFSAIIFYVSKRRYLIPIRDPRLNESLHYDNV